MLPIEIDRGTVLSRLTHIAVACLLAVSVAWNRERTERGAGFRTFPLVSAGACGYMMLGAQVLDTTDAESRVIYGIITGIGFIGGGATHK